MDAVDAVGFMAGLVCNLIDYELGKGTTRKRIAEILVGNCECISLEEKTSFKESLQFLSVRGGDYQKIHDEAIKLLALP